MNQPPVPPPPPPSYTASQPSPSNTGWKVATALAVVMAILLPGTVYLLMDRQVRNLEDNLAATREALADAEASADSQGLADLFGGLDGLDGLGDLADLLGLDELLGDGTDDFDPVLFECLSPDLSLDFSGEGSIPDADIETQVAAIRDILEEERGLAAAGDLDIEFVSRAEVQRRAIELTEEELDHDAAELDARLLAALGAVEPGTDLVQAQLDALDAGVGGFYNPETEELVIGSEQMDGMGAYVTAHEMVHALADSVFGLPDTAELAETDGSDAAYAAINAIEGDATLYGQMFISNHLPMAELLALEAESAQTEAGFDSLPHFVRRNLEFPYIDGMTFTCHLFLDGGWDAVDDTYAALPTTSAQILFPDRYRSGEGAVDVRTPGGPPGWQEVYSDTFGAADLLFLLEAPGGDTDAALTEPKKRVEAWAGGEATAWDRDGDTAVALILAQHDDGPPLCETMTEYYAAAFPDAQRSGDEDESLFDGGGQAAIIRCEGDEVALGIGPDTETARAALP